VVFNNPRVLTLETGVPAMGIPWGPWDKVVAEFGRKRITHVILSLQDRRPSEDSLLALISARPTQFRPVFSNASYDVRKFIARPSSSPDSGFATTPDSP
jgi:hypothetical protein